jgi:serine phosphatase RsbU (regulator of sigma subunit)
MFTTIRRKIFIILLFFSFLNSVIVSLAIYYNYKKNKIYELNDKIDNTFNTFLHDNEAISDFLIYDRTNAEFFINAQSQFTRQHDSLINLIRGNITEIKSSEEYEKLSNTSEIDLILSNIDSVSITFDTIVKCLFERGYNDFGAEGQMRNYIHKIENMPEVDLIVILTLRRHEKDYIIRNDEKYIQKLKKVASNYMLEVENNSELTSQIKDTIVDYLTNYIFYFDKIVELDKKTGYKDNSALMAQLQNYQSITLNLFSNHKYSIIHESEKKYNLFKILFILISGIIISLSVIFSIIMSGKITHRVKILSQAISKFIESKFTLNQKIEIKNYNDEIDMLISNYNILSNEIIKQITYFEEVVEQRTSEIQKQNRNIISSITYAKNIQEAILPNSELISKHFADFFVFYSPKAIVSGDFYWFKHIENKNISIMAVADCTGHGVPGALMSMLGIAFLNDIVTKKEIKSSGQVLGALREQITSNLKRNSLGKTINDGIDISLVVFYHNSDILQYSGANRSIYLSRNDILTSIKGDNMPIGKYIKTNKNFKTSEIQLFDNDHIYLFTDGFADQFGGEKNKKYMRKNFKSLISSLPALNMKEQNKKITEVFNDWKQNLEQTDDVLVMGIKYKQTINKINLQKFEDEFKIFAQ